MSEKVLDWSKIQKSVYSQHTENIMKNNPSFKDRLMAAHEAELNKKPEDTQASVNIAKSNLVKAMVGHKTIRVLKSFKNITIGLSPTSEKAHSQMETIEAGEELQFVHLEKILGQFILKSKTYPDKEYAIYKDDTVNFNGQYIENPGLLGLLFNTDINN
jgi:hypothetical protein